MGDRLFGQPDVMLHLKAEPITRAVAEESAQSNGKIGGYRGLFGQ